MLFTSSFDLWKKDAFFSAAEEVQDSADILDSAYRLWLKVKREGEPIHVVDELHRELKTALGTAKWQLEEFEKAIRLSYRSCGDEDRSARHQQFVVAMETQISCVEDELTKCSDEEGKDPLRWVYLDEEEKDDLAMFLNGETKKQMHSQLRCDEIAIDMDSVSSTTDGMVNTRRTLTVPNVGSMQIVVPDENDRWRTSATTIEATPKVKGSRILNSFPVRATSWISQITQSSRIFGRKLWHLHASRSVRLMISLLLIIFLLGNRKTVTFVMFSFFSICNSWKFLSYFFCSVTCNLYNLRKSTIQKLSILFSHNQSLKDPPGGYWIQDIRNCVLARVFTVRCNAQN